MKTRLTKTKIISGLWLAVSALILTSTAVRAQTPIACGQTIAKTTTSTAQTDQFSHVGSAGQILAIGLSGAINCSGTARFMVADIYSPSGQFLKTVQATCNGGGGSTLQLL